MKKLLYILIISCLISCLSKTKPETIEPIESISDSTEKRIPIWKIDQDTILEKNNPKNLDLNKHQLFIDTTRTSSFYKAYFKWKPHEFDIQAIEYYSKEISKKHKPKNISIGDFPSAWITLKMLNNEFVLYDACDGISTRYLIGKKLISSYNIEADTDLIHKLKKVNDTEIEIEFRTIPQKSKSERGLFSIKKTNHDYVYTLTIDYGEWQSKSLVTPLKHVDKFDLVVNHCVKTKRLEYQGFDKINFNQYE